MRSFSRQLQRSIKSSRIVRRPGRKKRQLTHQQTNNFMNRFRNLIISHHHFAIVVIGSTMTAAATTVQAHTRANGFNDGFAKAKLDLANNQTSYYTRNILSTIYVRVRDRIASSTLVYRLTNYIEMIRRNVYYYGLSEC